MPKTCWDEKMRGGRERLGCMKEARSFEACISCGRPQRWSSPSLCSGSGLVDWISDTVITSVPAKHKVLPSGAQ
jgi:hypothetical protein